MSFVNLTKFKLPILLFALFSTGLFSCTPVNYNLSIKMPVNTLILIPGTSLSCTGKNTGSTTPDLSSLYYSLPTITLAWNRAETLTIISVTITLKGSNITAGKVGQIAGDDLLYTWYDTASPPNTVTLAGNSTNQSNLCPFKIGSVSVLDPTVDVNGTATLQIYGIYTDSTGNTVPVTSEAFLSYYYKGTGAP